MTDFENGGVLTVERNEDGTYIIRGDIDIAGGPVLDAALADHLADVTAPSVVLDLGGVSFIDSSGLRSLLATSRRAAEHGREVVLRNVGPEVARLVELTGTGGQFSIELRHD